jgi:hypothetical protein
LLRDRGGSATAPATGRRQPPTARQDPDESTAGHRWAAYGRPANLPGMGIKQFAISYDSAWLLTAVGMGPRSSGVQVDSDQIRVQMGSAFRLDIPQGSVRSINRDPALGGQAGLGVHGLSGRWLVNGSANGLVELTIEPPCYTERGLSTLFRRAKVHSLTLSLVDPDGFVAALEHDEHPQ